jgi:hypothetical protein
MYLRENSSPEFFIFGLSKLDRGHCSTHVLLNVNDSERLESSTWVLACSDKVLMALAFELIILNVKTVVT